MLGIDLGTSQVQALVCVPDGTALGQGTAGYQVSAPVQGWAETDPEDWWHATCTAVRSAVGPARAEGSVLAAVGQMHGLVPYSERTGVLRPAIVWLDPGLPVATGAADTAASLLAEASYRRFRSASQQSRS